MSGGSFDYMYSKIRDTYKGELDDPELEDILEGFCEVLKALEWWQSGDRSEEDYRKTVENFKKKWLNPINRACYPVRLKYPNPHRSSSGAYYDPTRCLLFTGYLTAELAENLGMSWVREETEE